MYVLTKGELFAFTVTVRYLTVRYSSTLINLCISYLLLFFLFLFIQYFILGTFYKLYHLKSKF